jgi:hypothetical protein
MTTRANLQAKMTTRQQRVSLKRNCHSDFVIILPR